MATEKPMRAEDFNDLSEAVLYVRAVELDEEDEQDIEREMQSMTESKSDKGCEGPKMMEEAIEDKETKFN